VASGPVALANGVSVEAVAVCRNPREAKLWWKPDGTSFDQPPVEIVKLRPPDRGATVPSENEFLVCIRWNLPPTAGTWQERLLWQPAQDEPRTPVTVRDRQTGKEYSTAMICFKQPPETVDLQVNAALASWEQVAVFDGKRTRSPVGTLTCTVPVQEGDSLWFDIVHDHDRTQFALRMKARLKDGREVEGDLVDEGGKGAVKTRARLYLRQFTAADVKEYVFERTRWLRGEMRGIALAPQSHVRHDGDPPGPHTSASAPKSPREAVAEWLRQAKAGHREAALALTTGTVRVAVGWRSSVIDPPEVDTIRPVRQLGNQDQVMVVTSPFRGAQDRANMICAMLLRRDDRWLIDSYRVATPDEITQLMQGFQLNQGVKFDVPADDLVGGWDGACTEFRLEADGTGQWLVTGPEGPLPKPIPFRWEVKASSLILRTAEGEQNLEITWVEDDSVRLRFPNGQGRVVFRNRRNRPAQAAAPAKQSLPDSPKEGTRKAPETVDSANRRRPT
jgi:hypothetical protein